jgi:tetratricopeptide (TPR) repeat protein
VAREQGLRDVLISSQVELAQADLDNKDYAGAAQRAQQVLKLDKGNAEANDILARANESRAALETAAQEATAALASGDTEGASRALSRVLAIDPRHPVVAELSASLNSHFSAEAEQARKAAAEARVQAETAKAAASQPFQAADRLVQEGQTLLGGAQYAEATQKFLEAGITFDRARRAAEAAAAAQARSTAPPPTAPAERVSAAPATPGTAVVSSATLAPPPQTVPSRPSLAPALPAAPPAPTVQETAASAEQAVRRVISDYGRALETKDLDLFRNVKPNLSGDEEKRLRESFRAVKSHEVGISVDSVQIDGPRAVVRVSRQDTINGNAMKPLQQTFHLLSRDGAWAIESIGQ